jgi:hypothetical protein
MKDVNCFKQLCAELVSEIQALRRAVADECGCPSPEPLVIARARAALAEGDGVGPADEELETLVIAIQALVPIVDDGTHLLEAVDKGRDILRRALHNYGTTHPRPIPVAERLPCNVTALDIEQLQMVIIEVEGECNLVVNGECRTGACLTRGGWIRGASFPQDSSIATCPALERAAALKRIAAAIPVPQQETTNDR